MVLKGIYLYWKYIYFCPTGGPSANGSPGAPSRFRERSHSDRPSRAPPEGVCPFWCAAPRREFFRFFREIRRDLRMDWEGMARNWQTTWFRPWMSHICPVIRKNILKGRCPFRFGDFAKESGCNQFTWETGWTLFDGKTSLRFQSAGPPFPSGSPGPLRTESRGVLCGSEDRPGFLKFWRRGRRGGPSFGFSCRMVGMEAFARDRNLALANTAGIDLFEWTRASQTSFFVKTKPKKAQLLLTCSHVQPFD